MKFQLANFENFSLENNSNFDLFAENFCLSTRNFEIPILKFCLKHIQFEKVFSLTTLGKP